MPASEQVRHRVDHAGVEAGTHLLCCTSAVSLAVGYADFTDFTGLPAAAVFSDPVVATPIPFYAGQVSRRRWPAVAPEALWHPLFWLPGRVWRRRTVDGLVEPDPVWAVRVCLEVQAADLYEPDRGWVDVLAAHGLDTGDPDDMARVLSWSHGDPDTTLDRVDLTDRLLDGDGDWASDAAAALTGDIQGRAWAVIADELLGYLTEPAADATALAEQTLTVAQLALSTLLPVDVPGLPDPGRFWTSIETAAQTSRRLEGPVEDAVDWLTAVRVAYWPRLQALDDLVGGDSQPLSQQ